MIGALAMALCLAISTATTPLATDDVSGEAVTPASHTRLRVLHGAAVTTISTEEALWQPMRLETRGAKKQGQAAQGRPTTLAQIMASIRREAKEGVQHMPLVARSQSLHRSLQYR